MPGVRLAERTVVILGLARSSNLDGMYVLDIALAPWTRSSPVPYKVWDVNREELLRTRAALHMFGTDAATADFDAEVVIIIDLNKHNTSAD